jgi:hypothetical protein
MDLPNLGIYSNCYCDDRVLLHEEHTHLRRHAGGDGSQPERD